MPDAASDYIRRYAKLASDQARAARGERREELQAIASNCVWIAENPPGSFWEAFQLVHLAWSLV